jgi:hypothetical protein
MACRGTGRVISNLGGTPQPVTCPWCQGSGVRVPGSDAQARWLAERAAAADGNPGAAAPVAEAPAAEPEDKPGAGDQPGAEGEGDSDPPPAAA